MTFNPDFSMGTRIQGKWKKRTYIIERLLGEGSNGKVYLVKQEKQLFAMKMGFSSLDHQSEVNVLQSLAAHKKSQPYLIEADDYSHNGEEYPYYIMPYVPGIRFQDYLRKNGHDWFYIIGKNILDRLQHIHAQGWIFGDLKMDNVLVSGYGNVELIDYGGVTRKGRSVKQFTEIYDRGYWGAGSRVADEEYDLFSFVILCLHSVQQHLDSPSLPQNRDAEFIMGQIQLNPFFKPMESFFAKAIHGEFDSTKQASEAWKKLMLHRHVIRPLPLKMNWLRSAFLLSAIALVFTVYFVF